MEREPVQSTTQAFSGERAQTYSAPTVEVICLACEISAYAPDGDDPLF